MSWLVQVLIAYAVVGGWIGLAWLVRRRRGETPTITRHIKSLHMVQPIVQGLILAYLSLYWVAFRSHWPAFAAEIGFCYLVDWAWSWTRKPSWTLGMAPIPVVFSTNLFLFYEGDSYWKIFLLYAIAFGAKAFVHDRAGRHVFNPSALGMSVMTLVAWVLGDSWFYHSIDHEFWTPPNMVEVLFLVALRGQIAARIAATSIGGFLGLMIPLIPGHPEPPFVFYPATFIAILLLIPDPITSPRTPVGQLLFGVIYAFAFQIISYLVVTAWGFTGSAKILAVPIANLAVPLCDRVARIGLPRALFFADPRWAHAHLVYWGLLVLTTWHVGPKSDLFRNSGVDQVRTGNRWVVAEPDGGVRCEDNPVYCAPWSFPAELRMWMEGPPGAPATQATPGG